MARLAAAFGSPSVDNLMEIATYLFIAMAGLWVRNHEKRRTHSAGLSLLVAYGVLASASALWSLIPLFSFVRGCQVLALAVFSAASAQVWADGRREMFGDWKLIWGAYVFLVVTLGFSALAWPNPAYENLTWQWTFRPAVGTYLGLAVVVLASMTVQVGWELRRRSVKAARLSLAFCAVLLLLNLTRSAILAAAVAGVVVFLTRDRRGVVRRCFGLALFASAVAMSFWCTDMSATVGYFLRGQSLEEFLSLTGRMDLWQLVLDRSNEVLLAGHGFGASRIILLNDFWWAATAHNLWAEVLLGLGILGCLVISAFLSWNLALSYSISRRNPGGIAGLGLGVSFFTLIVSGASDGMARPDLLLASIALVTSGITAQRAIASQYNASSHPMNAHDRWASSSSMPCYSPMGLRSRGRV